MSQIVLLYFIKSENNDDLSHLHSCIWQTTLSKVIFITMHSSFTSSVLKINKRQKASVLYLSAGQRAGVAARAAFRCGATVRVTICTLFTGIPEEKSALLNFQQVLKTKHSKHIIINIIMDNNIGAVVA